MAPRGCLSAGSISEEDWLHQVIDLAKTFGWLFYHTRWSVRSQPGFPDLILLRGPRQIAAELKSDRGRLSPDQVRWLEAYAGAGAETHVWRPADLQAVVEALR